MPISFACRCGKKFQVKDDWAGKKSKCPACGAVLTIPAPAAKTTAPPESNLKDLLAEEGYAIHEDEEEKPKQKAGPPCPACNEPMQPGAVLCVLCGFDTRIGKQRTPTKRPSRAAQAVPRWALIAVPAGLLVVVGLVLAVTLSGESPEVVQLPTPPPRTAKQPPAAEKSNQKNAAPKAPAQSNQQQPAAVENPPGDEPPPMDSDTPSPAKDPAETATTDDPASQPSGDAPVESTASGDPPAATPVKQPEPPAEPEPAAEPPKPRFRLPVTDEEVTLAQDFEIEMLPALKHFRTTTWFWGRVGSRVEEAHAASAKNLARWAASAYRQKLYFDAEQCYRSLLFIDPNQKNVQAMYEKCIRPALDEVGSITLPRLAAEPLDQATSQGQPLVAAAGKTLVSLPANFHPYTGEPVVIEAATLRAEADQGEARLLGILHTPADDPAAARLWPKLTVLLEGDRRRVVRLEDPAGGTPGELQELYRGPYALVFELPEGQPLRSLQYQEEPPLRLPQEAPERLETLAIDSSAPMEDRKLALRMYACEFDPEVWTACLTKCFAQRDKELWPTVHTAQRVITHQLGAVLPGWIPTLDYKGVTRLRQVHSETVSKRNQPRNPRESGGSKVIYVNVTPDVLYRTKWKMPEAGEYFCRITVYGPPPAYPPLGTCEKYFTVDAPGDHSWETTGLGTEDANLPHLVRVIELFKDGQLLERAIIVVNRSEQAELTIRRKARLLAPPPKHTLTSTDSQTP